LTTSRDGGQESTPNVTGDAPPLLKVIRDYEEAP